MLLTNYELKLVKLQSQRIPETKLTSCSSAANFIKEYIGIHEKAEEEIYLICLDTKNKVIGVFLISKGTINETIMSPRDIFKRALLLNSKNILVTHNHPSGDATPSPQDVNVTKRVKEAGDILGIALLDHIIIGDKSYVSLKDKGVI